MTVKRFDKPILSVFANSNEHSLAIIIGNGKK